MGGDDREGSLWGFLPVWAILGAFVLTGYLVGGVALDHRETAEGYELLFRDPEQHWQAVAVWQYWLHRFSRFVFLALVLAGLAAWLVIWRRKEKFDENSQS
ncbi:hypothetical protein [Leisingera caerulea]|uniref:Uncharacterized protein n=1 Tax=Leisingera caerulea TaxID=506591 RepID=A0A9Q9M143_LEICA|nr:hypothetical protein [Leisingera caerulea]UWQ54262.1 hypothetical protein K3721_01620 [Leisingera caerulea]